MAGDAAALLAFAIAGQSNHAGIINMDVLAIALPFWVCAFLLSSLHVLSLLETTACFVSFLVLALFHGVVPWWLMLEAFSYAPVRRDAVRAQAL